MAESFALDTNVYILALRDPAGVAALKRFHLNFGTRTRLHGVVALELRAGVRSQAHARALESLIEPYEERELVVVPTFQAYVHAGRALSALAAHEGWQAGDSSALADAVLAASCREEKITLVTANVRHFAALQRHLRGFRFRAWEIG
jgi:predicted nucleic acid-binding protein